MGTWKCLKCGTSTWSANKPLVSNCPKGGHHRWTSGGDGVTQYIWRCSKCGSSVNGSSRPHNRTCPRGGNCSWQKIH